MRLNHTFHFSLLFFLFTSFFALKAQSTTPLAVYRVSEELIMGADNTSEALEAGTVLLFFKENNELKLTRARVFKEDEITGAVNEVRVINSEGGQGKDPWMVILEFLWQPDDGETRAEFKTTVMLTGNVTQLPDLLMTNYFHEREVTSYKAEYLDRSEDWIKMIANWRMATE